MAFTDFLAFCRWGFPGDDARSVLVEIGKGIQACGGRIGQAVESGWQEYADAVTDDEVDVIEALLGATFVVSQTLIARTVHEVRLLHQHAANVPAPTGPVTLTTTGTSKQSVMHFGNPVIAGTVHTIEAINSLANYFKHRDEWPLDWTTATGLTQHTITVIEQLGLSQGSSGNLRTGSEVLGNPEYGHPEVVLDHLAAWQANIWNAYEAELGNHGLL